MRLWSLKSTLELAKAKTSPKISKLPLRHLRGQSPKLPKEAKNVVVEETVTPYVATSTQKRKAVAVVVENPKLDIPESDDDDIVPLLNLMTKKLRMGEEASERILLLKRRVVWTQYPEVC